MSEGNKFWERLFGRNVDNLQPAQPASMADRNWHDQLERAAASQSNQPDNSPNPYADRPRAVTDKDTTARAEELLLLQIGKINQQRV